MRPLRLEVEGFAAFRHRTEIDFTDLDLVALVGPTGSGKSTVIDALTFALYGSVARYDNVKLVAPVIHQLATEAKVRFDFELAGTHYVAVRIVRRTKTRPGENQRATTREARLERLEGDGASTVLAGNVKELDQQVQQLLGLTFPQFTRTIVLPQGEFAEFLKDDPSDRQALLRKLLDLDIYARMGARAREQAAQARQGAAVKGEELTRLAGASPEQLATIDRALAALDAFGQALPARLEELAATETALVARRDEVGRLDQALAALAQIAVPAGLASIDEVVIEARTALDTARAALDTARHERTEALETLDAGPDPATLRTLLRHHDDRAAVESTVAGLRAEQEVAAQEQGAAAEVVVRADAVLAEASTALDEARRAADVAPWVARLEIGAPCPVCQHEVGALPATHPEHASHADQGPAADPLAAVEAARRAVGEAEAARSTALAAAAKADGRLASIAADVDQRTKELDDLCATLADQLDADTARTQLAGAVAAAERAEATAAALRQAEQAVATASSGLERAEAAEQEHRAAFTTQRDQLALLGPPPPDHGTLLAQWQGLSRWGEGRSTELQAERATVADDGRRLADTKAEQLTTLATAADSVGLAADPADLPAALAGATATARGERERLEEQLERRARLDTEIDALTEQTRVFDSLGQHLSASGFERWLLAEALDDLVERATARLQELSSGRYSLEAVDGSFAVRDHGNADERRDIRTLSGGEIFLASLSLALALSSSIAELAAVDGPRLESIFLDEGFGTLDADTLDILASAIEELSASGRLVCVVTHVRDLAERMPVRFEVRKGPTTATVERATD